MAVEDGTGHKKRAGLVSASEEGGTAEWIRKKKKAPNRGWRKKKELVCKRGREREVPWRPESPPSHRTMGQEVHQEKCGQASKGEAKNNEPLRERRKKGKTGEK